MKAGGLPADLRAIVLPVYLPTLIFSIGEGAIIPIIPASAASLGASLAVSGLVAGAILIGQVVGDIPGGMLVARVGERRAMVSAAGLSVAAVIVCALARSYLLLALGIFAVGMSSAIFALARHAFLATNIPLQYRARALSTLGGVFRAGYFVGPPLSIAVIHLVGLRGVYFVHLACCTAVVIVLFVLRDIGEAPAGTEAPLPSEASVVRVVRENAGTLARLGSATLLMSALRSSRAILLPLWAVHLGIHPADTALIVGCAAAGEFALFYTSGQIMDRFGRAWSAIPCLVGLVLGHALLIFVSDAAGLLAVGLVLGIANGIGSGIQMTLGADIAPSANPAPLLGAWRFLGDSGSAAAPLIISVTISAASLGWASGVMCIIGLASIQLMARYIPRYCPPPAGRRTPLAGDGAAGDGAAGDGAAGVGYDPAA